MLRIHQIAVLAALLAPIPSSAYYHFVHYLSTGNAPEKFDLTALPNQTVTFFVSESGPSNYPQNDSFSSVVGQIQQAATVWNGVSSSTLRVSFGGFENASTPQNTPGGDVLFEELPPGVEGYGGPTTLANPVTAADGSQFFPIVRSVMHLSQDLTLPPGPSYSQTFLMTTIHEMGHALGLQHTFTSASMSQTTTSATTATHPISADDAAGLSVLYPNANMAQFGSIAGTVTVGGVGVHLASVVAIQAGADAISAVTNPDGSFRMDGIPPGQYAVYVHTMPPDADIFGPWDASGNPVAASGPINSVFYPGTTDFSQATPVTVSAGQITGGIDIQTAARTSVPLYDGQVYGYFNDYTIEVTPAPVAISAGVTPVVASIVGLGINEPADGVGVQFPGGAVSIVPNGYLPLVADGYTYEALYLGFSANAQPGEQHMIFNAGDYMYVLPSAMFLTANGPPTVTAIAANGDGTFTVTGTNWSAGTLIYFDSLPTTILSLDPATSTAIAIPPAGANGQVSTLTAYTPDGQNSQILQSAALCTQSGAPGCPVTYAYGTLATPTITSVTPSSLPAGAEAMIDITTSGFSFAPGAATIGFGTTDITVENVYVLSPNHVQVDVLVSDGAALAATDVSAISGFEMATAQAGFQILTQFGGLPQPYPVLFNDTAGQTGAYPGAIVSLYGANLQALGLPVTLTIGGAPATILYASTFQINLVVPAGVPAGPAIVVLNNGIINSYPIDVGIAPAPAGIAAIQDSSGDYIYADNPAQQGEALIVTLVNFAAAGAAINPSQVQVSVGGVSHNVTQVTQAIVGTTVYYQVQFQLNGNDPVGASEPLIVYLNGLSSVQATIPIVAAPAAASSN